MSFPPAEALSPEEKHSLHDGIALIHRGEFFEAHEVIEAAWTGCLSRNRRFLQAIIHVAVGCHHQAASNHTGMLRQFRKAIAKLRDYPDFHEGLDLPALRSQLQRAIESPPEGGWDPRQIRLHSPSRIVVAR
ncbi:MAG: DUF309 domain-containing protein [Bryobacterales bacterium]|nr:DUF309 domain-containing protein [Bryobacterales bacterium]